VAAGLRQESLRELKRSPYPPSRNRGRGPTSKRKGGKGREKYGIKEGEGIAFSLFNFWLRAWDSRLFPPAVSRTKVIGAAPPGEMWDASLRLRRSWGPSVLDPLRLFRLLSFLLGALPPNLAGEMRQEREWVQVFLFLFLN